METFVQTFSDLIRLRLGELNLNAFSAENAAGLPADAIRNVLRSEKQAGPTLARTKEICDALGLEISIAPKHGKAVSAEHFHTNEYGEGEMAPSGFLTIPWAEPSAGLGSAPIAFSRTWLSEHKLKPDFLQAVIPDVVLLDRPIASDTVALLDTRGGTRQGHGIWCYRDEGKIQVSLLTFKGNITVVHTARLDVAPRIINTSIDGQLRLLGKVVWLGQSVPYKGTVG